MRRWNSLDIIFFILLIIGGLNWGLIGLFDFNLVDAIFGVDSFTSNLIYIIVGISAIYVLFRLFLYSGRYEKV